MQHDTQEPSLVRRSEMLLTTAAVIACMLLFAIIVAVAYLPNRPRATNAADIQTRTERLAAARSEALILSDYKIINRDQGTARLEIGRAVDLIVEKYQTELRSNPDQR